MDNKSWNTIQSRKDKAELCTSHYEFSLLFCADKAESLKRTVQDSEKVNSISEYWHWSNNYRKWEAEWIGGKDLVWLLSEIVTEAIRI